MFKKKQATVNRNSHPVAKAKRSKSSAESLEVSARGIKTSQDFNDTMTALIGDLLAGRVTPQVGNAVCNAGGKLLKMVELQAKYGQRPPEKSQASDKVITLSSSEKPNAQIH